MEPTSAPSRIRRVGVTLPTIRTTAAVRVSRHSILAAQPLLDLMEQLHADLTTLQRYGTASDAAVMMDAMIHQLTGALQEAASLELEIDVGQAAAATGLTPGAIRAHIRSRSLPARRVGKRLYRIKVSDLRRWSEPERR